jgi:tetratricopeptide (TPR) repeat protein
MLISKKWMCVSIVVVVMAVGASPLTAAPRKGNPTNEPATPPKARELRDKGIVALNLSRYDDAVKLLEEAYELSREPSILFDLVQAHRLNGNPERALVLCASFLRTRPTLTARNREEVDRTVAELGIIVEQIRLEGRHAKPGKPAPVKAVAKDSGPASKSLAVEPPAVEKAEVATAVEAEPAEEAVDEKEPEQKPLPPAAAKPIETAKADDSVRSAELLKSAPAPLEDKPRSSWLRSPWVWTAAGVVVAGIAAAVVVYESTKDPGAPRTSWGSQKVF